MVENPSNRISESESQIQHQLKEEIRLLEIEQNIKALETKIDTLSTNVADLVAAWKAAGWLVSAIKWVGGTATAILAIMAILGKFK